MITSLGIKHICKRKNSGNICESFLKKLHGFNMAGIQTSKYPEAVLRDNNVIKCYSKKTASRTGYRF